MARDINISVHKHHQVQPGEECNISIILRRVVGDINPISHIYMICEMKLYVTLLDANSVFLFLANKRHISDTCLSAIIL
jgi:hypothetical protein